MKWAEGLQRWSSYLSVSGLSESTIRQYRRTLVNFMADTLLEPNSATEDDIVTYVASRPAKGSQRGAILRALKSYYEWAADREVAANPSARLKIPRPKYGAAPSLDDEAITRIVVAAASWNPRYAWIILLLWATGGRAESIVNVRPEDVHGDRLDFRVAKGNHPYSVKLGPIGQEAVKELRAYGFPTLIGMKYGRLWQVVKRTGEMAGVHVWPHLWRHVYATDLALETDTRTWMELMNHQDLSQFRRYVATNDERMGKAVARR